MSKNLYNLLNTIPFWSHPTSPSPCMNVLALRRMPSNRTKHHLTGTLIDFPDTMVIEMQNCARLHRPTPTVSAHPMSLTRLFITHTCRLIHFSETSPDLKGYARRGHCNGLPNTIANETLSPPSTTLGIHYLSHANGDCPQRRPKDTYLPSDNELSFGRKCLWKKCLRLCWRECCAVERVVLSGFYLYSFHTKGFSTRFSYLIATKQQVAALRFAF